jgi:hypothetical protein
LNSLIGLSDRTGDPLATLYQAAFRRGLNLLRRLVTNFERFDLVRWRKVIKLLSCSWR